MQCSNILKPTFTLVFVIILFPCSYRVLISCLGQCSVLKRSSCLPLHTLIMDNTRCTKGRVSGVAHTSTCTLCYMYKCTSTHHHNEYSLKNIHCNGCTMYMYTCSTDKAKQNCISHNFVSVTLLMIICFPRKCPLRICTRLYQGCIDCFTSTIRTVVTCLLYFLSSWFP